MDLKKADVSIIIPLYNGQSFLKECMDSIFSQSLAPKEVIVIDDGSTDKSSEIVHQYSDIKYLKTENKGVANARNEGIFRSASNWIAFLDQDDYWTPDSLKIRFDFLQRNNQAKIITGKQSWFLDGLDCRPPWVKENQLKENLDGYLLGCVIVKKDLFIKYGLFDTAFRYASDFDWFFRLKDGNEEFFHVNEIVLKKRIHQKNESRHAEASLNELTAAIHRSILRKRKH